MGIFSSALASSGNSVSAAQQPDPWMNIVFIVALFLVMYFFVIRPQAKKQKALKTMVDGLNLGDEIVTTGGLAGRIVGRSETFLDVKIAENVQVSIQKSAVATLLPKGTLNF